MTVHACLGQGCRMHSPVFRRIFYALFRHILYPHSIYLGVWAFIPIRIQPSRFLVPLAQLHIPLPHF